MAPLAALCFGRHPFAGWRVLNVGDNATNETLTGPWNFNSNNEPGKLPVAAPLIYSVNSRLSNFKHICYCLLTETNI
jgi:hypothetical protein